MPTSSVLASTTGVRFTRSSFYEVLGIPMTASSREIKAAYRKLARTCHPDVVAENSAEEFIKIQTAYSTLSDPDKRADYDREICRAQLLSVSGLSSRTPVSGYSDLIPSEYRRIWRKLEMGL
ncbi:hypothetical protein Csa_006153 [Cucumis sativus]|nr:hypothetical protein Csa_006153 [Cucumis sativus]